MVKIPSTTVMERYVSANVSASKHACSAASMLQHHSILQARLELSGGSGARSLNGADM